MEMKRILFLGCIGLLFAAAAGPQTATPQRTSEVTPVLTAVAGPDRTVIIPAKTYLNGYVGYGDPPRPGRGPRGQAAAPPAPPGPPPAAKWSVESGPGTVTFADAGSPVTTATFSAPGAYVLKLSAASGPGRDRKSVV
jgi:hypothetical protein